jgi:hypothetical protein
MGRGRVVGMMVMVRRGHERRRVVAVRRVWVEGVGVRVVRRRRRRTGLVVMVRVGVGIVLGFIDALVLVGRFRLETRRRHGVRSRFLALFVLLFSRFLFVPL